MLTGGGLLLLLGAASGRIPDPAAITAPSVAAMLFLTFVGSLVGFTSYLWLLGKVPATQVATYAYVNPIVAVFLGWALAGEQLTARSLAASWQPWLRSLPPASSRWLRARSGRSRVPCRIRRRGRGFGKKIEAGVYN